MTRQEKPVPFFEHGYNATEATALQLGVSSSYLNKARLSGGGPPYVKFGHAVRYHWPTVRAWAEGQTRRSTSDRGGVSGPPMAQSG
jgi:hypothetical protein